MLTNRVPRAGSRSGRAHAPCEPCSEPVRTEIEFTNVAWHRSRPEHMGPLHPSRDPLPCRVPDRTSRPAPR